MQYLVRLSKMRGASIIIVLLAVNTVYSWNSCSDEPFCVQIRSNATQTSFVLDSNYINYDSDSVVTHLIDSESNKLLTLRISAYQTGIFRFIIDDPDDPRLSISQALNDPQPTALSIEISSSELTVHSGESRAVLVFDPFKIYVYNNDDLILIINDRNRLIYNTDEADTSIAVDFTFTDAIITYGIPLHAESFALRFTADEGLEPYRLYNVDHCCYANFIQDSLYGAEPVLYGHSSTRTSAVFWLNAAQTFVDLARDGNQVKSLFISETGIMDIFVLPGPTFDDAAKQYIALTGPAPLPQHFTLGYHQSRWSYVDQEDAETVLREFDNHDFPLESIWFDVDYMNESKSFTWDYTAFPDPVGMQELMGSTGRKVILIIHPHFGVEEGYFVYDVATANDYFVKYDNGTAFVGEGWPGDSSWLDFINPDASAYFSTLYRKENFPNTTDIVYVWNDMNEPEVFDGFERTWPRNVVHYNNISNREVRNIYSFSQVRATYAGLLARYENTKRPYLLSRSHFSGSQRYTIVWTGDNNSTWTHLQISFPMCLSLAVAGISHCGADIGGFAGNLTDELFQRWHQAGAWIPFFRGHSTRYVERREPYLYSEEVQTRIRNAMRQRYYYLPLWYTLFYEHERYGTPVIKPLVYHYPSDEITHNMDDQWLVGADILVHPVAEEGASDVRVYFPGGSSELWIDIDNNLLYLGLGYSTVPVTLDSTPLYHRGGSIVARKEVHRSASEFMHSDPYSIYVFLDVNNNASSTLYIDDNESFDYRDGVYNYYRLSHNGNALAIAKIDEDADYPGGVFIISRILVYRPPTNYKQAVVNNGKSYDVSYGPDDFYFMVENVEINVDQNMNIKFI